MEEDYFGDITVPLDEEEEDATNDLTFGHIGDIKAGDEASDAFWKPGHQEISTTIEAEKEALQHHRTLSPDASPQSANNLPKGNGVSHGDQVPALYKTSWQQQVSPLQQPTPQHMLQPPPLPRAPYSQNPLTQPVQSAEQLHLLTNHAALYSQGTIPSLQPLSQIPRMPQVTQVPPMPQPAQAPQPAQSLPSLPSLPPQYRNLAQQNMSSQEYERTMLAYYETHARQLLMRHKETAEMQLREAEAAQRVGVLFDRSKFDEHQNAVRQRILSDHYSRVNHLRFLVWQHSQQVTRLEPGITEQSRNISNLESESNKVPVTMADSLFNRGTAANDVRTNGTSAADSLLAVVQDALRIDSSQREHQGSENIPHQSHKSRRDKTDKPQRLLEIERQMAEAGLGPTKHRGPREKHRPRSEGAGRQGTKKKERRLESMTEKDQELVFRVHLRQVESSVVYKDDYYNAILKKKEKLGEAEVYADLAERVRAMRQFARERGGEGRSTRCRRSKRASLNDEHPAIASPTHSDQNMKALATALGTVQSWNPRAPRRVMDFGVMEQGATENGDGTKLLRDDERVQVRHEIERGYDIIATIHDIARGESTESLEGQIKDLLSTLHIGGTHSGTSDRKKHGAEKTRFFATLCVIDKGREYLKRLLDLLDIHERVPVLRAAYENLGALLFSLQKSSGSSSCAQSGLPAMMFKTIQDPDISAHDCLAMLHSFIASHTSHRDALLTTFRSALGSKLVFLCMQRISRGLYKHELLEEELSRVNIERFSEVFTTSLQDIFEGAESVTRVWEVVASMDGLAIGEHKMKYRAELNNLLRSGAAPPPPGTKSAQEQQQTVQ